MEVDGPVSSSDIKSDCPVHIPSATDFQTEAPLSSSTMPNANVGSAVDEVVCSANAAMEEDTRPPARLMITKMVRFNHCCASSLDSQRFVVAIYHCSD